MKGIGAAVLLVAGAVALLIAATRDDGSARDRHARAERPHDAQAAGAAEPAAADEGPPAAAGSVRIRGIAVDRRRHPVAGCAARIERDGAILSAGRAGADGGFEVPAPREAGADARLILLLDGGDGRGGEYHLPLQARGADVIDLGRLVLSDAGALDVLVSRNDAPVAGARVALWPHSRLARTDGNGNARFECVEAGERTVYACADNLGRGAVTLQAPHDGPVTIALTDERVATVTVVDRATGRGIEGATLVAWEVVGTEDDRMMQEWLPPLEVAPTDDDGRTLLRGLPPQAELELEASAPGYPVREFRAGTVLVGTRETQARIELDAARTVRWTVVDGASPVPPDGTRVVLEFAFPSWASLADAKGRIEGHALIVEGLPDARMELLAFAPDGAYALLNTWEGEQDGGTVSFAAGRTLDVLVRERGGEAIGGLKLWVCREGGGSHGPPRETDPQGRVRFDDLLAERVDVFRCGLLRGSHRLATADLTGGPARLELTLEPRAPWRVHVTVDGKPRLPSEYELLADGLGVVVDAEDPERGLLTATCRPPGPGRSPEFVLWTSGYSRTAGTIDAEGEVQVALRTSCRCVVTVAPPADGRYYVQLQRRPPGGPWGREMEDWVLPDDAEANPLVFSDLAPGIWRLVDSPSGTRSEALKLAPGESVQTRLDLTSVAVVHGCVVLPEGGDMGDMRLDRTAIDEAPPAMDDPDVFDNRSPGCNTFLDGRWDARVPGDRPVLLHFRHLHYLARAGSSPLRVTGTPAREPVVKFTRGAEVTFDLPDPGEDTYPDRSARLYAGPPDGEPVARPAVYVDRVTGRPGIGGIVPGRYTLWLDVPGFAPLVLPDLLLGEGTTDLGALSPPRGSTLRVRLKLPPGHAAPRLRVIARHAGRPDYVRGRYSRGEAVIDLAGLGRGTFEVSCTRSYDATACGQSRTITVDGTSDVELVFEME